MKKNALLILTAFSCACLFLFACRKNLDNYFHDRENVPSQQIESAKIWRLQHLNNLTFKTSGSTGILKPHWSDAYSLLSSTGKNLLIVPAPEQYIGNKEFSVRRFFVFSSSGSTLNQGNIIEIIGKNYDVSEHADQLLKNHEAKVLAGFNGAIIKYDINYRFISSMNFINGKKQSSHVSLENIASKEMKSSQSKGRLMMSVATTSGMCAPPHSEYINMPPNLAPNCIILAWKEETTVDGCVTSVTYTYMSHTCPAGVSTGQGSGQGSSQGGGSGSGSGSGTGAGDNPPYGGGTSIITSDCSNLCIAYQVTHALEANNSIKTMLEQEFLFNNLDRQLNFNDVTNLADTVMGITNGYNNTINISFNENILPQKSNEYILATVYHEILHGYMNVTLAKDSNGRFIIPNDHNTMATNYVAAMTGALKTAFPNLSDNEAWALSWGGLEKTTLFNSTLLTDTQRAQIKEINNRHQKTPPNGATKLGTFCTTNF